MKEPKPSTAGKPVLVPSGNNVQRLQAMAAGSEAAPVMFFDNVISCGLFNGIVQLELTANVLIPIEGQPQPKVRPVVVAHLRCSVPAAQMLAEMAKQALGFAAAPAPPEKLSS